MISNKREQEICDEYREPIVRCNECPLARNLKTDPNDYRCKATAHYNFKAKEWEYDGEYKH